MTGAVSNRMPDGRHDGRPSQWSRRVAKALAIVAVIVLVGPVSNAALRAAGATDAQERSSAQTGIRLAALVEGSDANAALSRMEQLADAGNAADALPDGFEREIGVLPGARDVRVSGSVVGYVVDGNVGETLAALDAHMEGRGWTCVPMGDVDGATFLKEDGVITWTFATCTQVGSATSVVLRCT